MASVDVVAGIVLVLFIALITFWDNGYTKWLTRMEPDKPTVKEDEDEWDYDDQGELVKVAKPARPESRYPVPPLDLPHYHGLELGDAALTGSTYDDADDATKEVTGA